MRPGPHPTEALSAYLDGELSAAEGAAVEEHLRGCAACAALRADLERLAAASRDDEVPPVPAGLAARVAAAIAREDAAGHPARREERLSLRRLRAPLAAAAMLAVATALWVFFQRSPEEITRQILSPQPVDAPRAPAGEDERARDAAGAPASDDGEGRRAQQALGKEKAAPPARPVGEATAFAEGKSTLPAEAAAAEESVGSEKDEAGASPAKRGRFAPAPVEQQLAAAPGEEREVRPEAVEPEVARTAGRTGGNEAAEPGLAEAGQAAGGSAAAEPALADSQEPTDRVEEDRADEKIASAFRARAGTPAGFAQAPVSSLQGEAGPASSPAGRSAPAGERALLLGSAAYQIRLTESGGLLLRAEDYECGLLAAPEETTELMARAVRARVASGDLMTAGEGPASPWTLRMLEPDGTSKPLVGHDADVIARRLRDLVGDRYAPALVEACGPLPAPFGDRE